MVQSLIMGVDIGHHSIKAVVLKPSAGKYTLFGYKEIRVTDDIFADNHAVVYQKIVKKLKELKKGLPLFSQKVVIAIPDNTVISKILQIDSELEANEREFAIHQAFSHQSPFAMEDVNLDFVPIIKQPSADGSLSKNNIAAYQVYATKREVVESRVLAVEKAGLKPVLAEVQSHALVRLWQLSSQKYAKADWLLVDIGHSQTTLCLDFVNKPPFYKQIAAGVASISIQARSESALPIKDDVDGLAEKIAKQIQLFISVNGPASLTGIWLTGGGANIEALQNALIQKTALMCDVLDPFSLFSHKPSFFNYKPSFFNYKSSQRHRCEVPVSTFATAAGLALSGINWLGGGHAV
ncbi:MAG: type IV pilus assembly protein PilM [Vibrio sp.]|uniref:type IV pilus assembly protein PilM n=1 Tax=Vibrio sp. TaxID=678 RepID=UPI003A866252